MFETPVEDTNNDRQETNSMQLQKLIILISLALRYGSGRVATYKPRKSK